VSAPFEAAARRLLDAGMDYELARDLIADEIADAGAGCIARVARTASTPAAWRMVSADIERWQHPSCPGGYAEQLAVAARLMRGADREMGPALAVATLDGWTCEGTAVFVVESPRAVLVTADVVPCGAGLDAHVSRVPGCTEDRVVATLRERATGRMAHRLAFGEGATTYEAIGRAHAALFAALQTADTIPPAAQETV
jgi:hypothetical protein